MSYVFLKYVRFLKYIKIVCYITILHNDKKALITPNNFSNNLEQIFLFCFLKGSKTFYVLSEGSITHVKCSSVCLNSNIRATRVCGPDFSE